jgi:hypothetical protein
MTSLSSSYTYLESKLGGDISLSDNYIKRIISSYQDTHNSTDKYFYLFMILPIVCYNFYPKLNLQYLSKNIGSNLGTTIFSILACIIGFFHIAGSYNLTVPADDYTNTKILKELVYPLIVIIGIFIYSIIDTTNNKGKHILYSSILTLPALIIIILNTVSMFSENVSSVITILNYVFVSIIAVIIIIYIVFFKLGKGLPSSNSPFYSIPLWIVSFLILGRVFKIVNKIIMNYNSRDYVLQTNTSTSKVINTNIRTNLNNIIDKLDIKLSADELYTILTSYKLKDSSDTSTSDKYSSSIYYFLGSSLDLLFYWLFGKLINNNVDVEKDDFDKFAAFPILGFNNKDKDQPNKFNIKTIIMNLLGIVSTKIFLNGYANNNIPNSSLASTSIINILLTGAKFMLIPYFGMKYNKWYEYIVDEENEESNKYLRYGLRVLYAGLDITKSQAKLTTNRNKNKVHKDQYFEGNKSFLYMILFFIIGSAISTYTSMDYFTNVPLTSFILTLCKYISIIIIMIFYYINKNKQ